jgi:hypothetical protein
VSDETAGGINHVSAPVPGKFDLRQHVQMSLRLTWAMLTPVSRRVPANDSVM